MADLYNFTEEDAFRFAKTAEGKSTKRGRELVFQYCPYCKGGSKKDTSTFSINLTNGQFQCKRSSCNAHGNMLTLARDFNFSLNDEVDRYFQINSYSQRFKKFLNKPITVRDPAIMYLKSRGISEEITRKFEITTKEDADNILCFPFRDEEGNVTFIKYRNVEFKKGDKGNKEWCEKDCKPILFGMDKITEFDYLVITEGQIDSLSVVESGINNAVSVPTGMNGFTWLPHCWDWLQRFSLIIVFGDCEKNKITLLDYLSTRLGQKVKGVRPEDYQGCKDANEMLVKIGTDAIIQAIENAKLQTSKRLKDMSTIKAVDMSDIPILKTGINEIDIMLDGGIRAGQLVLQSGERGNGKSTWGSQVVIEGLTQNYNALVYSGELPDFYVKNWLDRQILGKQFPTQSEIDKAEQWYRNRLFLFDNNSVEEGENEIDVLISAITEAISVKDCKFILLDNLMTVVDGDSNEALYRQQSKFVNRLSKIAKKYSVMIMLIAHPRKQAQGLSEFKNDSVSGSADITNLADIVMSYDRVYDSKGEEVNQEQRKMSITKNRLGGKLTSKSNEIYLFFDEKSKRITDKYKKFDRVYITDTEGFAEVTEDLEEQMQIPF